MAPTTPSLGATVNSAINNALPHAVADKLPHIPESKAELKEVVVEAEKKSLAGLRSLVAGGFGGICAVIVGHPFDLVKVRLQTAERGVYSSAVDVVRKSIARDGVRRGLYAGVSAPLVGVTPMCTYPLPIAANSTDIVSRRLLLGLRCRQEPRSEILDSRKQPILRRTDLGRGLLLRYPYDAHHRPI